MQDQPRITLKSWIMITALGLIWGSAFTAIRLGLEGISPMWLAAARISIGAALTTILWGFMGWKFYLGRERAWAMLFVVGILGTAVPFQLITWAQQHVTSGYTGVSMAAVALVVLPFTFLSAERSANLTPCGRIWYWLYWGCYAYRPNRHFLLQRRT